MKTINVVDLKNYRGGSLKIPRFDASGEIITEVVYNNGEPVLKDGQPLTLPVAKDGNILDAIDFLIQDFPRSKLSMKHITEATRMVGCLNEARKTGVLTLEDTSYEWLTSILNDEHIGVPMFGFNLPSILEALKEE